MKTDVAKHESVTQKHLKSASHRTHKVVYMVCIFPFHGLQHKKDKITALLLGMYLVISPALLPTALPPLTAAFDAVYMSYK